MSTDADFAAALRDASMATPDGLRTWNGSDPLRRFNVYRNNVRVSITQALAATFPVTQALVGADFFDAMAWAFSVASPPVSPLLVEHGRRLPEFIAGFAPARELAYLADVARLEWLRVECHHAADAQALAAVAFRPLLDAPERLLAARLRMHPASRCLSSPHPVLSIWSAHQGNGELASVDLGRSEEVLVSRSDYEVRMRLLPPGAALFLDALAANHSLGAAAEIASRVPGFDLAAGMLSLVENGLAVELDPDG